VPALVLVDLVMPGMSGADLLRRLRAEPALDKVPMVLMTAALPRSDEPGLATEILRKPFDLDDLLATVARHCPPPP
jgi:CheY-like chemotaxis protein